MEAITLVLAIFCIVVTIILVGYHIYSYIKAKKENKKNRIATNNIVTFHEDKLITSDNGKDETGFVFEKTFKENGNIARKQLQTSGSIRLAADSGFDYDEFIRIRDEEFSHSLIGKDLGVK